MYDRSLFGLALKMSLVISLIMTSMVGQMQTVNAADGDLQLEVNSAMLIEASTGTVLYQLNADVPAPPASMSKMMTEYLVLESIQNKNLTWNDTVSVSKYASEVIGSGQLLAEGEKLTVRDMLKAVAIYSSNDASVALAERVAGSEPSFSKMMNDMAKKMNLKNTNFINSTGLSRADIGQNAPVDIPGETMMSARDLSLMAKNLINEHPEVLNYSKITSEKLRPSDQTPMINWNWMLEGNASNQNFVRYAYQGLDGLKTGHTNEAGYCFTGTAVRNGMRLISVVMGAKSEASRFLETRKLLDYGFNLFEMKNIVGENHAYDEYPSVPVMEGVELEQSVATKSSLSIVVKKGTDLSKLKPKFVPVAESKRMAPINKGTKLADAIYEYDGQTFKAALVSTTDTEKAGWFRLMLRAIKDFIVGLF